MKAKKLRGDGAVKLAEKYALAQTEAERIAKERGAECFSRANKAKLNYYFGLCGLPCSIASACNPFGVAPAAFYDDAGTLLAVCYSVARDKRARRGQWERVQAQRGRFTDQSLRDWREAQPIGSEYLSLPMALPKDRELLRQRLAMRRASLERQRQQEKALEALALHTGRSAVKHTLRTEDLAAAKWSTGWELPWKIFAG